MPLTLLPVSPSYDHTDGEYGLKPDIMPNMTLIYELTLMEVTPLESHAPLLEALHESASA